ncbi:MAG: LuxR family transcriptional regulator, partial [Dehalococcoidia bacterium]|nr:LuxR family transcriptional regulator [Dehalococcoidia bacterium]
MSQTVASVQGEEPDSFGDGDTVPSSAASGAEKVPVIPPSIDRTPDDTLVDSLMMTKISLPPCRLELVARPRLLEKLSSGLRGKLTLLLAPTGFGKTTMLCQWSRQSEQPIAWVSLEAADNDPARFWAYVLAALQTLHPHLGIQMLRLLRLPQPPPMEALLTILINDLAATPADLILVLDDYQSIESPSIHAAIAFLLDHLPPQVHLVIASRADPPIPLARMRAKGQLTELKAGDLAFTSEETIFFLNELLRLGLSLDDVTALAKCTEGWIVGLQLAGLALKGYTDVPSFIKAFAGGHRYVVDYLVEEVLRRQAPPVQTFLLQTSLLDRLSGSLCEAVTGLERGKGQAMLETLEQANLFTIPLDNERQWYRYPPLFAGALRACLGQIRPDQAPELHRRASLWYRDNGLLTEAVSHALAAKEFALAAELIEESGAGAFGRGEAATLMGWLRQLPPALVAERPKLRFWLAYAPLRTANLKILEAQLREVETYLSNRNLTALDKGAPASEEEPLSSQRMLEVSKRLRARIAAYRGDASLGEALSIQTIEDTVGDPTGRSSALLARGEALWRQGDGLNASEALAEASAQSQAA